MKRKKIVKPKLRKRILVTPRLNQKMPEITDVKGGVGSVGDSGLGENAYFMTYAG